MIDLMFALILDYRLLTPDYQLCADPSRTAAITVDGVSSLEPKERLGSEAAVPFSSRVMSRCLGGQCAVPGQPVHRWRLFRRR